MQSRSGSWQVIIGSLLLLASVASAQESKKEEKKKSSPRKDVKAPDKFRVLFESTKGKFVIEATREWSPNGADRFYDAVRQHFYDGCAFFRVLPDFVVQFGINGDPATHKNWRKAYIQDDKVKKSNLPGTVVFAMGGPNTRTTQLFINYGDNSRLDELGFSPFGQVVQGMDVVRKIHSEYGQRPDQGAITTVGTAYLKRAFPRLDYIKKATLVPAKGEKKE